MRRPLMILASLVCLATFVLARAAHAASVPIDGRLDAAYGAVRSAQVNATNRGDTPPAFDPPPPYRYFLSDGSELDNAYAFVADGTLHLFFGCNLRNYQGEPLYFPDVLEVFIDGAPGGQNVLRGDNPALGSYIDLADLGGLRFDTEFTPDYWFSADVETYSLPLTVYGATLPAAGGASGALLGRAEATGPGTLSGGTNPFAVMASIDQSNRAGVGGGCGPSAGDGVTTGVEFAIPLAALGDPSGTIGVCAFIADANYGPGTLSNQVLGPLPVATCDLGPASGVDFSSIPGAQYFTVDTTVPARATSWGRLKVRYR